MSRITDGSNAALWKDPALNGLVEGETAAVLWSLDGERVIAASAATAGLAPALRAAGGENLRGRLRRVAATLSAGSGIRLERVTLPQGYGVARLLLECHRVATRQGEFLLTILRGQLPRLPRIVEADFDVTEATDARVPLVSPLLQPEKNWRTDAEQAVSEPNPVERLFAFAGDRVTVRFIWESDAEGRLTRVSQELAGLVGRLSGHIEGKLWSALVADGVIHDPQHAVSSLLIHSEGTRHVSWSGLEVLWRIGDAKAFPLLPIELAGIPIYDSRQGFQGYRGFGLARVGRLRQIKDGQIKDGQSSDGSIMPNLVHETTRTAVVEEESRSEIKEKPSLEKSSAGTLTDVEKQAFRDIARALSGATVQQDRDAENDIASPGVQASEAPEGNPEKPSDTFPLQVFENGQLESGKTDSSEGRPSHHRRRRAAQLRLVKPDQAAANDAFPSDPFSHDPLVTVAVDNWWSNSHSDSKADITQQDPQQKHSAHRQHVALGTTSSFIHVADRLPLGILISRGSEVLFANRALLDLLGYDHMANFTTAGGLRSLFMGTPGAGDTPLSLRTAKGAPVATDARMATVQWEGCAATLMSFRRAMEPQAEAHLRELERELRQQEARVQALDTILDTAADGIVTLDGAGRLMSLNCSAEALLGCEETEVVGAPLWHLLTLESRERAQSYFNGLCVGGLASVLNDGIAVTAHAQDGGEVPFTMVMGKLPDGPDMQGSDNTYSGSAQRYFAILRDTSTISARVTTSNDAVQSGQREEFLARVSHEISTPLKAIMGFTEAMLEERFGPIGADRYRAYLADIHASGSQVINLVSNLLDLARIESGHLELAPARITLNDVVSSCVDLMMPQAGRLQVVLRTSLAGRLPVIHVNERALQQVILNLLSNAVKYTDAGGQVIVSTARADDGGAALRIRDTGVGMTRTQINAAMEPFSQLSSSFTRHSEEVAAKGAGIGLPLTRALVEASGGRFHISSTRHEGTLVEIAFPPLRETVSSTHTLV